MAIKISSNTFNTSIFLLSILSLYIYYIDRVSKHISKLEQILFLEKTIVFSLLIVMIYLYFYPFIFSVFYLMNNIISNMVNFSENPFILSILKLTVIKNNFLGIYLILFAIVPTVLLYIFTDFISHDNRKFFNLAKITIIFLGYSSCYLIYCFNSSYYIISLFISFLNTLAYSYIIYMLFN